MENQPKKSKALIITVIALILLLILGYFVFKNKDNFGVKTSTNTTKTFSPLTTSENPQTTIAQAGEDLSKGDSVSVSGTGSNKVPIVVKATNNSSVFGIANQNISNGNTGEIMTKKVPNSFFNSFSNFLGGMFKSKNQSGIDLNPNPDDNNGSYLPQCIDGIDNNNDGRIDAFDPNCHIGGDINKEYISSHFDESSIPIIGGGNNGGGDGNYTPQCSDKIDNDKDGLIDESDPNCHVDGDITKKYIPTHYSELTNPVDGGGDGNYTPQCSDKIDNDKDGLIDESDPNCHVDGDLNKEYIPTHYSESSNPIIGGDFGYSAQCDDKIDNDGDGQIDISDPNCHVDGDLNKEYLKDHYSESTSQLGYCSNGADNPRECTTIKGKCLNGANNPTKCDAFDSEKPDLVASIVSPTSATVNTPTSISSIITNTGGSSTTHSFSSFFTIIKATGGTPDQVGTTSSAPVEISTVIPTLEKGIGSVAKISYTFTSADSYQIRACADKSSSINEGTVTESNEDNNCGPWTTFTVSNSLPTEGDVCSNGADNPAVCTTLNGLCLNGANNPPECTNIECSNGANNPPECTNIPETPVVNACLLIDQNPLTFTDSEKSQLAELLRKFYLIAPTLKTTDDVSLVYSDILQQSNFSNQLSDLINKCEIQTSSPSYTGPTTKYGNPWYRYDNRGSYLSDAYKNTPSYCTKAPGPWPHKSFNCPAFTDKLSCEQYTYTPWPFGKPGLYNTGCTWVDNLSLPDYETILNIW